MIAGLEYRMLLAPLLFIPLLMNVAKLYPYGVV